jgi:hypothetical protein
MFSFLNHRRPSHLPRRRVNPRLEVLEDRTVPTRLFSLGNIGPLYAMEGVQFSGPVLEFHATSSPLSKQARSYQTLPNFTATVDWGDGCTNSTADGTVCVVAGSSPDTFDVLGSHTYAKTMSSSFSVTVGDTYGSQPLNAGDTVQVADAPLYAGQLTPPSATEGISTGNVVLFHFTDANPAASATDFTAVVNWGDTSADTNTADNPVVWVVANADGFDVVGSHTYTSFASGLPFSVTVQDVGGATVGASDTVQVAEVPLYAGQLTPPSATEGISTGNVVLFHFTDANPNANAADYTAMVNWGDTSSDSSTDPAIRVVANADGGFDVVGSHTYASFASGLPFSVTVQDVGGATVGASDTVSVAGAPMGMTGAVIFDANQNGSADPGEQGIAGLVVFADADGNGILNGSEVSAVTDAQGRYVLQGLTEGQTYTVCLVVRSDFAATGPTQAVVMAQDGEAGPTFSGVPFFNSAPIFIQMAPTPSDTNGDRAFVLGLYHDLLGRDGSTDAGVNGWVGLLNSGWTRSDVAWAVYNSQEYRGREVDHYYQAFLGRQENAAEQAMWVNYLQRGGTEEQMAGMFLNSVEYQGQFPDNAAFVASLYDRLLGRTASDAEVAGWVDALNAGTSREDVVRGFVHSQEAAMRAQDGVFASFLRREADATEQAAMVDLLQQPNAKASDAILSVLASDAYWSRFSPPPPPLPSPPPPKGR